MTSVRALLEIIGEFDDEFSDCPEKIVHSSLIEYSFPEPIKYEANALIFTDLSGISANWVTRLILFRYFGFSFLSTRIEGDDDCAPIWKEIADNVNFFLDLACKDLEIKHRVVFEESGSS